MDAALALGGYQTKSNNKATSCKIQRKKKEFAEGEELQQLITSQ